MLRMDHHKTFIELNPLNQNSIQYVINNAMGIRKIVY